MRTITVKYEGECRKCRKAIPVGAQAVYEKRVGVFCPSCGPVETEEIRDYRQEAADKRAAKYEEWAAKRRVKAETLHKRNEPFRGDHAFNTQPGHIPERVRVIRRTEKAFEHTATAARFEGKAQRLRKIKVRGDADRKRQEKREEVLSWLKVGMSVDTILLGVGTVEKINKKTAKISNCGQGGTYECNVDLSYLRKIA